MFHFRSFMYFLYELAITVFTVLVWLVLALAFNYFALTFLTSWAQR